MKYCECEGEYVDDYKCNSSTQLCQAEQRAIARKGIYQHSKPSKGEQESQEELINELIHETFGASLAGREAIAEKFIITRRNQ